MIRHAAIAQRGTPTAPAGCTASPPTRMPRPPRRPLRGLLGVRLTITVTVHKILTVELAVSATPVRQLRARHHNWVGIAANSTMTPAAIGGRSSNLASTNAAAGIAASWSGTHHQNAQPLALHLAGNK